MSNLDIKIELSNEIDESCGTKAVMLYELKKLGIPVPEFYVISSTIFLSLCQELNIQNPKLFYANSRFDASINNQLKNINIINKSEILDRIPENKYMVRSSSVPSKEIDLLMFPSMISGAFESFFASSLIDVINNIPKVWESVYSEKAYKQCRLFSKESIIDGIGVLIQQYVEPVISGVAHTNNNIVSINWIEGHLSKIVNGETIGQTVDIYKSCENEYILRGIENNIMSIKNNCLENVFRLILETTISIKQYFEFEQEIEWIYDGEKLWVVQTQSLLNEK